MSRRTKFNEQSGIYTYVIVAMILLFILVVTGSNKDDGLENTTSEQSIKKALEQVRGKEEEAKPEPISEYVVKYAGEYKFIYPEFSEPVNERWFLYPDGTCTWRDVSGGYRTEKYGTWSAKKGYIHTVVIGRSGDEIAEDYNYKKGYFSSFNHYLLKIKDL